MKTFIEIFGWLGMVCIVLAYALLSFSVFESANIWFQALNGFGSLGILVVSYYKQAYQPMVLNFIWVFIAAVSILRMILY